MQTDINWPAPFNEVPKEVFYREDVFQRELEQIFRGPEWHMLAHRAELPQPGDFKTALIGDASVLLVHGQDGEIRVFANACPHRGTQLATASRGRLARIQCPYHRWTFSTHGELLGAPGMEAFPSQFRKEDHALRRLPSAELHGVVFATLSGEAPAFEDWIDDTSDYIAKVFGGDGRLRLLGYQKVMFDSNWKVYSDNEGYHSALLHGAFRMINWSGAGGRQFMTVHAHKVNSVDYRHAPDPGFLKDPSVIEGHDPRPTHSTMVTLFPLAMIVTNLDSIALRYAFPLSVDRTEVHYAYFAREDDTEALASQRVRQASNLLGPSGFVSLEDGAVFNRIQAAAATPGRVAFQKGVKGPMQAPVFLDKAEEAGNLIRWEHYRKRMGFERQHAPMEAS